MRGIAAPYSLPGPNQEEVLFRFAEKLTKRPADITKADADSVRAAGWDEAALFETAMTVALFNLYNRVSIGLGLMADI